MQKAYIELRNYADTSPAFNGGMWYPVHLARKLGPDVVMLFALLVRLQMREKREESEANDGWFRCTVDDLAGACGKAFTTKQQERHLPTLEAAGLIKRKVTGSPVSRYMRIDYDEAVKGIEEYERQVRQDIKEMEDDAMMQTRKRKRKQK